MAEVADMGEGDSGLWTAAAMWILVGWREGGVGVAMIGMEDMSRWTGAGPAVCCIESGRGEPRASPTGVTGEA